jgi:hypothetical protein
VFIFDCFHFFRQATGDLDAAKLTVVPIIRRLLQGTKSFLDAAVRGQEKLKTINGTALFFISGSTHALLQFHSI